MPTYVFENKDTGEVFEDFMKISEAEEYLEKNPHIKRLPTAPNVIGGTGDRTKPPSGFNDVLSREADNSPFSPLAETHGKKDRKSVAKREIVKKARKKFGKITN